MGGYLVAFALIGHAGWDAYHYLRNRVVGRSYAEWCAVVEPAAGRSHPLIPGVVGPHLRVRT
jgi:hypothetical protein